MQVDRSRVQPEQRHPPLDHLELHHLPIMQRGTGTGTSTGTGTAAAAAAAAASSSASSSSSSSSHHDDAHCLRLNTAQVDGRRLPDHRMQPVAAQPQLACTM